MLSRIDAICRAKYRQSKHTYATRQLALDRAFVQPKTLRGFPLRESLDATQPHDVSAFLGQ